MVTLHIWLQVATSLLNDHFVILDAKLYRQWDLAAIAKVVMVVIAEFVWWKREKQGNLDWV